MAERRINLIDSPELGRVTATEPNEDNGGLPAGLPMPRDPRLFDRDHPRVRVTRHGPDRYPFPVPNGWFIVATSAELRPGDVQALHYFDRDLRALRTEDGQPAARRPLAPTSARTWPSAAGSRAPASAARSTAGPSTAPTAAAPTSPTAT